MRYPRSGSLENPTLLWGVMELQNRPQWLQRRWWKVLHLTLTKRRNLLPRHGLENFCVFSRVGDRNFPVCCTCCCTGAWDNNGLAEVNIGRVLLFVGSLEPCCWCEETVRSNFVRSLQGQKLCCLLPVTGPFALLCYSSIWLVTV